MKKSILQKLFNITVIFVCLFFVTNMFSGCSLFGSKKGFDVTGRIVDDYGVAVEGVKIESDYGTTYTNSQGVYSFSKVKNGIIVTPSIDKYKFAVESKSITNGKDNADFVAYKEYTVSGKVENNGIARPDAELVISSLSGTFYANTDDNGEFKVAGVAGETTISCLETGVQFYPVKANITNPNVVINTTSNLTLKFSFDTTNVDYNQIRLFIDDSMVGINSNEMTFDVHYNSKIKLVSDYYDFNKPEFNISSLNQIEEIEVYKKYDVVGKVQSGKTNIAGASVRIAGKEVAVSDENGNFEIYGLSKTNELSIVFDGLTFNKVTISQFDTVANFNGTKSVYLIFDCDHRNLGDVSISHDKIKKVDDTTCILSEVCLGDEIELSSSVYNLSETNVLISVENLYSVSCHALYNLNVGVSGEISNENDFEYLLDGSPVSVDAFGSLFGKHTVSASYKDYKFETYDVDFENVNVNIEYLIPYSVTFLVQSGNVLISNVLVELNGEEFYADSNGNIVFDKVYGENEFVISAENYNSQSINVNSATNQTINLSYNVNGIVQTGTNAVTMAKVYVDGIDSGIETDTNGEFVLLNIFGSHEISVVKNNYNFQMQEQVCHAESLNFNGNYKIFGTLSDEESVVVGGNIYLVDAENNRQIAVSDNNGYYEFNGLTEKYLLYTMDASGNFKLKPNSYSVSYDFNYGISGTSAPSYMYYDTTYTISNPSRTGYVFTGWSITGMSSDCEKVLGGTTYPASTTTKSGITGTSFKNMRSIDGYVYLTANWSVTTYYINYVYNNNGDNPTDYSNPTSAVYDTTFMVKNPVRRGYTFAGWTASNINTSTAKYGSSSGLCNTSWNGTNKVYYSAGTYFKNLNSTSGNVTLTANWTSNQYNIEYILNGGTTGGSMVNYAYYDSVLYVPNPIRTGYRFTGWKITGMNISDNVTNKPITHYYGTDSSTTLSFNGATFSPSSIYTYFKNLNSDKGAKVTFTAIWNANNFNINYNYNDGKSGGISPIVGIFDTDLKISNPIKTGYTFVSWSISGMDNTAHSYGETIMTYQTTTDTSITFTPTTKETWYKNLTAVHDATITFTANWSANTYNINFETNGSYNSYVDITATYKYPMPTSISDSNWTTIVNPVKTGYTFTGWSFSGYNAKDFNSNESYNIYFVQDGLIKSFSSTNQNIIFPVGVEKFMNLCSNVNNYVTFTANWSANVYNITYDVGAGTADLSNPTSAIYDQWFTINRPTTIPFGYYFAGWIVTLMNETDETTGETVIHFAGKSTVLTTTQTGNIFRYETDSDVTYFKNLYSNTNGTILITTIWNPNTYYLKYNLSDSLGSGYFESDALNPTEAKFNNKFTVSDPSRKGYTFMGWTLKDLTDDCEHYYYQDSNEIKFTTTNGKYLDPENVNNYIVVKASQFMNLRSNSETTEDAVTLTATWKANNYTVSYHYLPSNFDTSILGMGALNMATNMTAVKNQTVTYDKEFLTFKSANSDDETSIILPLNVKLVYWAFYDTVKDSLIAILDASGEISGVNSDYYFAQGSQAIFNFYGSDVHAYAVYKFTEITIKYLAPSSSAGLNDISTYEVVNTGKAQNYAQFTLSYVPAESSDKFIGWMLSANKYIDGYLTAESITQFTYNDIVYSTAKDSTIIWAYNSSSTAHIDEPTYYLYAVYNYTRPYSSTFVSSGDSYQNNAFYDEICLDEDLVEYVDELNNNMIFDNKN